MEALAAAASVFAVVSLAGQLASNIQALIDFWDSMKEAPTEVAEIQCQLRVLRVLLQSIELDNEHFEASAGNDIAKGCFGMFAASILKLENVSIELEKGLNGNGVQRRWTRIKKALRGKKLEAYWSELERAKSTLIMYQGWKSGCCQERLLKLAVTKARGFTIADKPNAPEHKPITDSAEIDLQPIGRYERSRFQSKFYELQLSFGVIRVKFNTHLVKNRALRAGSFETNSRLHHKIMAATFHPTFNYCPIITWNFTRRFGALSAGFQTLNVRPGWSKIFHFASNGDIPAIQGLIEEGLASPNDVDPDGWTVLHCAAVGHHAELCRMLIELGAKTDCVTNRLETPLLLCTKRESWSPRKIEYASFHDPACTPETVRVLIEKGRNDPMDVDQTGWNSLFIAAVNDRTDSISTLLNQDEFEIDLSYVTTGGQMVGGCISTREYISTALITPLLWRGIDINAPCKKVWYFRFGPKSHRIEGPSMLQCTVWHWYHKLLDLYANHLPWQSIWDRQFEIKPPQTAMRILLECGASLYLQSPSGHTILDGLLLNITQFDGAPRPAEVLTECMGHWLCIIQELGFKRTHYIQHERKIHQGLSHDLGLGISMEARFDVNNKPHIWGVFQGPEERDKGVFVDHISKCARWRTWQLTFTLPKPPPRPKLTRILSKEPRIIVISEELSYLGGHNMPPTWTVMDTLEATTLCHLDHASKVSLHFFRFAAQHPREYSFYVFVLTSFLGFGYPARILTTLSCCLILKVVRDTV